MCTKNKIIPPTKSELIDIFLECLLPKDTQYRALPSRTQSVVSRKFEVSRELVRQRMEKLNIRTDTDIQRATKFGNGICEFCSTIFPKSTNRDRVCSRRCRADVTYYRYFRLIRCKFCKEYSVKSRARSAGLGTFCGKICQGSHMAKHFGFQPGIGGGGCPPKSPSTKEELKRDFPGEFTVFKFAKKYQYTNNGADSRIRNLRIKNIVRRVEAGIYRIKD